MSYTPNVPLSSDIVSETQVPILTNFQVLNTIFGNDHYQYTNSSTLRGKHKFTTFPDRRGAAPTTLSDEQSFYNSRLQAAAGGAVRVVGKNRDAGSAANQIFPVAPFAMAEITCPAPPGVCTISSFNLNIAATTATLSSTTLQVDFQEAAPATTPYLVFATYEGPQDSAVAVTSKTTTSCTLIFERSLNSRKVYIAIWCFPE